jgi:type II secretory pathway pseudopilin PulG
MRRKFSPAGETWRHVSPASDAGTTIVDLVAVLGIVAMLAISAVPLAARAVDLNRGRQAASFLAARARLARHHAVATAASVGVVFDQIGGRWMFRICTDGNDNGIRRAEIGGIDACTEGPFDLQTLFPGVRTFVNPALRGPDNEPGNPDPVRLGSADIASFSPLGSATSGTVFLETADGTPFLVRIAGVTGRTRILRYDAAGHAWRDE